MIVTRVTRLSDSFRSRTSEWMLAVIMLGLGLEFNLPEKSFDNASMMQMTYTMSEQVWAMVCMALGAARLIILIINGAWRKQAHARAVMSTLYLLVWSQIAIVFLNFPSATPGDVIFPVFTVFELFLMSRAAIEAGATDAGQRNGGA